MTARTSRWAIRLARNLRVCGVPRASNRSRWSNTKREARSRCDVLSAAIAGRRAFEGRSRTDWYHTEKPAPV